MRRRTWKFRTMRSKSTQGNKGQEVGQRGSTLKRWRKRTRRRGAKIAALSGVLSTTLFEIFIKKFALFPKFWILLGQFVATLMIDRYPWYKMIHQYRINEIKKNIPPPPVVFLLLSEHDSPFANLHPTPLLLIKKLTCYRYFTFREQSRKIDLLPTFYI